MSPKNNLEQQEARELAASEGVNYTTALRKVREGREQKRAKISWDTAFSIAGFGMPPTLLRTEEYPSREEWETAAGSKPYRQLVRAAVFQLPQGSPFSTFADLSPQLASYIGADGCAITPVGMVGPDGAEIPGTVGNRAFRVWYTEEQCAASDPLDPALDGWLRQFLVLAFVMPRLAVIDGIGGGAFVSCEALSHETLLDRNITIRFKPSPGVGVATVRDRLHAIKDVLGVKWALVEADSDTANPMVAGTTIALHLGDGPRKDEEPSLDLARTRLVLDIIETAKFTARENPQRSWSADDLRQEMLTFKDSTLARLRDALGGSDRRFAEFLAADILSGHTEEQQITFLDRIEARKRASPQVTA